MQNLFSEAIAPPDDGRSVGCEYCPLNYIEGLKKVKGLVRIKGRKGMLWVQSPGKRENAQELELVGPSGQLVWEVFKPHGITRNHLDIQNVVRCRPLDETGEEHPPTKQELRCCSIYNEEALDLNAHKAKVHLILGEVAGKALLRQHYKKDNPFFWYAPWEAYVILAPHPSHILRQGGIEANTWSGMDLKERVKAAVACMEFPGRWGFLKAQDNGMVQGEKAALALEKIIEAEAAKGRRVSVDIEDGTIDGKRVILMVGFGWGKYENASWKSWNGAARSVVLDHREAKFPEQREAVIAMLKRLLENPKIRKVFQHGSYDVDKLKDLLGITLQGYDYDTQYGSYLYNSGMRKYGLDRLVRYWFMEFMDYKEIVAEWKPNLANAPLEALALYNCGDCHLTKRIEQKTLPKVSLPLLHIYIQDAFVIDSMEGRGPILDRAAHKRLMDAVPGMMADIKRQLCHIAQDDNFNPGSAPQVAWFIYDYLKLPELDEETGRSTKEEVLQTIAAQTGSKAPILIIQWRALNTIRGTFLVGYQKSADEHDGELRTIWHLTGASSGRMRSGGGEETEKKGIVNFQNVHGNPLIKNLLVSDLNWRKALAVS